VIRHRRLFDLDTEAPKVGLRQTFGMSRYIAATARAVLCMTEPWLQTAVELQARGLPASTEPVPRSLRYPWGVKLANGKECIADQGAHDEYRGRVVDYSCGHAFHLVLLRGIHQSRQPWTYDSAIWTDRDGSDCLVRWPSAGRQRLDTLQHAEGVDVAFASS
jgi:hypothetical protein